ncbi:MAG: amino acid ABC transporter permease, partial [Oscillospiraceae bacterium]|nr:amino acid ABC transporter permease [Oscillospiraceae bacterium]
SRILRLIENKIDGSDSYELAASDTLSPTSGMLSAPKRRIGGMRK